MIPALKPTSSISDYLDCKKIISEYNFWQKIINKLFVLLLIYISIAIDLFIIGWVQWTQQPSVMVVVH